MTAAMEKKRAVRNHNWTDLHPDDLEARLRLREVFRDTATRRGMKEGEVSAAAGFRQGWAFSVWSQTSWRTATVQRLARALDLRLSLYSDLPPVMEALGAELAELRRTYGHRPDQLDEVERMILADRGRRLREALGVDLTEMGHRLRQVPRHVEEWESGEKPDYLLLTAQRYFRALRRPLSFALDTVDGKPVTTIRVLDREPAAAPTQPATRPAVDETTAAAVEPPGDSPLVAAVSAALEPQAASADGVETHTGDEQVTITLPLSVLRRILR